MRRRSWRRLAGYIAIELTAAALLPAASYKAAVANVNTARALALQDSRGNTAILAQAEFRITQAVADLVSVQIMRQFEIDRAGILLRWSGIGNRPAQPEDLLAAITEAVALAKPAVVRYTHRGLTVEAVEDKACVASVSPDGNLGLGGCWEDGTEITGEIRAALQMVEPAHGLMRRGDTLRSFPVQAIGLGKVVTILALSGEATIPEGVNPRGLIFAPFSNESIPPPRDTRFNAAVQKVLARTK